MPKGEVMHSATTCGVCRFLRNGNMSSRIWACTNFWIQYYEFLNLSMTLYEFLNSFQNLSMYEFLNFWILWVSVEWSVTSPPEKKVSFKNFVQETCFMGTLWFLWIFLRKRQKLLTYVGDPLIERLFSSKCEFKMPYVFLLFTSYTGARPVPLNSCFDGSLHFRRSICAGSVEFKTFLFLRTVHFCVAFARIYLLERG